MRSLNVILLLLITIISTKDLVCHRSTDENSVDLIDVCEPVKRSHGERLALALVPEKSKGLTISKRCLRKRKTCDSSENDADTKTAIIELKGIKQWPKELIYDQGTLGSCTANALAFCIRYLSIRNSSNPDKFIDNPELLSPSRLYFYYNARYLSGFVKGKNIAKKDTGVTLEESVHALQRYGCCPETFSDELHCSLGTISYGGWSYNKKQFSVQPAPENYRIAFDLNYHAAERNPIDSKEADHNPYAIVSKNIRCSDLYTKYSNRRPLSQKQKKTLIEEFKNALRQDIPIFFGVDHNENFENNANGFIKTPEKKNFSSSGAHAISLVGYGKYNPSNPNVNYFKFINSYGCDWGDSGYGYIQEDYVTSHNIFSTEAYSIDFRKTE